MLFVFYLMMGSLCLLFLLLQVSHIDTVILWQADQGFLALSNDEDVADSSGKLFAMGVLDVDNIETAQMSLSVKDGADSANVVSTGDIGQASDFELQMVNDLVGGQIELDGVED